MKRPLALLLLLAACSGTPSDNRPPPPPPPPPPPGDGIRLVAFARGLQSPVYVTAPSGPGRVFIVEQPGRIRVVENGQLLPLPFLDIVSKVSSGGERGLLSVAFHPRYAQNGYFYVNYTDRAGDTRIERYRVSGNANVADAASARLVLAVDQPYPNHNGGLVMFGPDGKLYVGMGDGGSAGDPGEHAQNPADLLGDILRLDVDAAEPYAIPPDNPFVGQQGRRGEIWITGVRNPWRFAFDAEAGLLYVADVGQGRWEEVTVVPATQGGLNFGWDVMEGRHCYEPSSGCDQTGLTLPVHEYAHENGACSITGGFVYRGQALPAVRGHYFYADYCAGWVRSFRYSNGQAVDHRLWELADVDNILSFGQDASGELYVTSSNGDVFRLAPEP